MVMDRKGVRVGQVPPPTPVRTDVQLLAEIRDTMNKMLEVSGLEFALDPTRYIARKLRSGEAISDKGSYYQLIAGGGTFTLVATNPAGYVWIGLWETARVSQEGVIEFTRYVDDELLPWLYVPRLGTFEFNWSATIPFGLVARENLTLSYTNHDAAPQWIVGGWIGAYLRKDVWERDSKYMDLVAEKYIPAEMP